MNNSKYWFNAHHKISQLSLICFFICLLFCCNNNKIHHLYQAIPAYGWVYPQENVKIEFDIADTNQNYSIDFFVRSTDKYTFCNLYFQYRLYDSSGHTLSARLKSVDIYDCKTGEPLGSGSTGLYTNNLTLIDSYRFPYRGKYGIELMQYMRLDTLTGIQSVGLSVAKIQ